MKPPLRAIHPILAGLHRLHPSLNMSVLSSQEFFGVLERSGLLGPAELDRARLYLQRHDRPSAVRIAQWLVKRGYVTVWQAERLLGGNTTFFLAGTYKFIEAIAEGAMGVVFKAEHLVMGRTVAVKVLSKARLLHPNAIARFHREVQAMAALDHENIVRAYDAGQVGRTYYLVMEYIEGADLNAWQDKYDRLPVPWACEFIRQTSLGLDHAHQAGMVHRDIKPANIMVAWNEDEKRAVVKVLDLGLARAVGKGVDDETDALDEDPSSPDDTSFTQATASQLTQAGTILGTPDYLAPEQIVGHGDVDARADVFSLGCTLFKLMTGQLPYSGPDLMGKLQARINPTAPPAVRVRRLLPKVSPELDAILAKMLERDPDKRFQTAAEVALALAPFAEAPSEKWTSLSPARAPSGDSSEVGSSQMVADPKLTEFFGGLKAELGAASSAAEIPVIKSETRSISGDATASSGSISDSENSGSVLDDDAPDPAGSAVLKEKYQARRQRQHRLTIVALVVLIIIAITVFFAFLRVVTRPTPSPSRPSAAWPGDTENLIVAWERNRNLGLELLLGQPDDDGAPPRLEPQPGAEIDELGFLNLEKVGAFRVPSAEQALVDAVGQTGEFSLEMMLSPLNLEQTARDGMARILTFSDGDRGRNFSFGQQNDELILRLRTSQSDEAGREVRLGRLPTPGWHHVIVTFQGGNVGRVSCFLNGETTDRGADVPGDLSVWSGEFYLLFGCEPDRSRPWSGRVERFAIYSRAIRPAEARQRYAMIQHDRAGP